jgi:hypothetical protein
MFATDIFFYSSLIFSGKTGAYHCGALKYYTRMDTNGRQNPLAYYEMVTITVVKKYVMQAPEVIMLKFSLLNHGDTYSVNKLTPFIAQKQKFSTIKRATFVMPSNVLLVANDVSLEPIGNIVFFVLANANVFQWSVL